MKKEGNPNHIHDTRALERGDRRDEMKNKARCNSPRVCLSVGCGWPNNKRLSEKYKGHVLFPFADTVLFGYDVVVSILSRGES